MHRTRAASLVLAAIFLAVPAGLAAQDRAPRPGASRSDSVAVAGVVDAYHRALETGDAEAARALLTPDVRVLEGGGVETLEEYTSHHLEADMAFAAAVERERGPLDVTVRGDVAWVVSSSRTRGTFRGRKIDSRGAELMVLARRDGAWRIEAIHWSSRSAG